MYDTLQPSSELSQNEIDTILDWQPQDKDSIGKMDFGDYSDPLQSPDFDYRKAQLLIENRASVEDDTWDFSVPPEDKQGKRVQPHGYDVIYRDEMLKAGVSYDESKAPKNDNGYELTNNANDYLGVETVQGIIDRVDSLGDRHDSNTLAQLRRALIGEAVAKKARQEAEAIIKNTDTANLEVDTPMRKRRVRSFGKIIAKRLFRN